MPIIKTLPKRSQAKKSNYDNELFSMTIGSNIFHWRKYRWLSQQELAKKSELTQTSISDIENWDGNPTLETLFKISSALEIPINLIIKNKIIRRMIEAIDYITQTLKDVDILKAMKLLYFIDFESQQKLWQKIIWLEYKRRSRWPFNQDVYQLNDIFTKKSEKYIPQKFKSYITLSTTDQKFLDTIIEHYWNYKSAELMNLSYQTPPMRWFKKWDEKWMGKIIL